MQRAMRSAPLRHMKHFPSVKNAFLKRMTPFAVTRYRE